MKITNALLPTLLASALVLLGPTVLPGGVAEAQRRADSESLEMEVGDQVTIPGADVASYSEGTEGIVSVRYDERSTNFVLAAQRPGVTSLLLIYTDGRQVRYRVTVLDPERSVTATGGVPVRENIRMDMYFLQLDDNYTHSIGIGWPSSFGGGDLTPSFVIPVTPAADPTITISANITQLLPRLDLAMSSGWGRIMRQAMLVTANGEQATINAGGEINFQIITGFSATIRTITFGSILTVTPRYDSTSRRIDLTIAADISELTAPFQAGGPPSRTRTQVTTLVNLELGESLVLGGMVARTTNEVQGGLPGLSQIPILGVLFGTNARNEINTENYLFIVPTVVEAVSRADADRITEVLDLYRNYGAIGGRGLNDIELIEPSPPGFE